MPMGTLGILPMSSLLNPQNEGFADGVLLSNDSRWAGVGPYGSGSLFGDLRKRMGFRVNGRSRKSATFRCHIRRVVSDSPHPQVCRVYARRVVTGVADEKPCRDRAIVPFIRIAVSANALTVNAKKSVPCTASRALPLPAGIRFVEIVFETGCSIPNCSLACWLSAGATAIAAGFLPATPRMESRSASQAYQLNIKTPQLPLGRLTRT